MKTRVFMTLLLVLFVGCSKEDAPPAPTLPSPLIAAGGTVVARRTSATITGHVNPRGVSADYWCEYGMKRNLGYATSKKSAGDGNASVEITAEITSLNPETIYYFRWRASGQGGEAFGEMEYFGTQPPNKPPVTWLSSAPPQGSPLVQVQLFWGGWDPDGQVSHHEFQTNTNGVWSLWSITTRNDSTWTLDAGTPLDWYIWIRAVDDEGLAHPRPPSLHLQFP